MSACPAPGDLIRLTYGDQVFQLEPVRGAGGRITGIGRVVCWPVATGTQAAAIGQGDVVKKVITAVGWTSFQLSSRKLSDLTARPNTARHAVLCALSHAERRSVSAQSGERRSSAGQAS